MIRRSHQLAPEPASSEPRTRVAALDGIRGFAVAAVVAYHAFQLAQPAAPTGAMHPARWVFGAGRLGVDLFFVLSGFLLVESWESLRRRPGAGWRAFATFVVRRARRIGPAYWISLAVLVPLFTPELLHSAHGLLDLALLATFQQYLDPHLPGRVNVVYWSLTTEVHFYLLLPVLAYALRRAGRWPTLTACLALSFAWRLGLKGDLPASWITGRIDEFVAGMVAAGLVADFQRGRAGRVARVLAAPRTGVVLWGMAITVAFANGAATAATLDRVAMVTQPVVGLLVAALLTRVFCLGRVALFERPVLQFLGATSYSLYLWHRPILLAGTRVFHAVAPGTSPVHAVVMLTLLCAVAVLFSAASYALVERPFIARQKRRRDAPDAAPTSAADRAASPRTRLLAATAGR